MNRQYRHLTLRHEQRLLSGKIPELQPGEAKFHSYYLPSLQAAEHTITVNQDVTAVLPNPPTPGGDEGNNEPVKAKEVTRKFTVVAPRYSISDSAVATTYPAPGHTAQFRTLPHMVLRDPHFPWERPAARPEINDMDPKNHIPWVALVVFTANELQLDKTTQDLILPDSTGAKVNQNLGFDISVKNTTALPKDKGATVFVADPALREMEEQTSVVALPSALFRKLFVSDKTNLVDMSPYRFLSHVRTVSTDGMVAAIDGESGTFSIVVSHRLGPLETHSATPVTVHLLSLDGLNGWDASGLQDRVIMTSLYSWTYTALPSDSFDVVSAMQNLGTKERREKDGSIFGGLTILRTGRTTIPAPIVKPTPPSPPPSGSGETRGTETEPSDVEKLITERQEQGFTLVRHRTVTGETTAAMYRGPLVPTRVPHPLRPEMTIQSNFGTDLQILDAELGLMDISYASAWQLGRTLAMGDSAFTTTLARLRGVMHRDALERAKKNLLRKVDPDTGSHEDVVRSAVDSVGDLNALNTMLHQTALTAVSANRWKREQVPKVDMSLHSEHIYHQMFAEADQVARAASRAVGSENPSNFHTVPANTDYAAVRDWVLDKLHLASIPAHYLIADSSHLPPETLRFFHVDENWTESLVDGALSLANHVTSKANEDFCRTAIKKQLGDYLAQPLPDLGYCQQMPKYGFLLRSQVLVQFPDLTVSAQFRKTVGTSGDDKTKPQAPILVQRRLETDVMLVLFDRVPPDLASLEFALPPHQQTFEIAKKLDEKHLTIAHKRIYACPPDKVPGLDQRRLPLGSHDKDGDKEHGGEKPGDDERDTPSLFDWQFRTMKVVDYADYIYQYLNANMAPGTFNETAATSAIFALQLNEPIHTLQILANNGVNGLAEDEADLRQAPEGAAFSFNVPEFPADKYQPTNSLPQPLTRVIQPRISLNRQTVSLISPLKDPFAPWEMWSNLVRERLPDGTAEPLDKNFPVFEVRIYPFEHNNFVPTNRTVSPDLIVRLILPQTRTFRYTLRRLEVSIPLGDPDNDTSLQPPALMPDDKKTRRPLAKLYSGKGAPLPTMLSNLHFDVLRRFDTAGKKMVLAVVARSSKGVNLYTLEEASFLLPKVDVIGWAAPDGGTYKATVMVTAYYIFPDKTEKSFSKPYDIEMGQEAEARRS